MASELAAAVLGSWETARAADQAEATVTGLDLVDVGDRLKAARRQEAALANDGGPELEAARARVAMLGEQYASLNRIVNHLDDVSHQLDAVDLRLHGAVAHAAEVALGAGDAQLQFDVRNVTERLAALRAAIAEVGSA